VNHQTVKATFRRSEPPYEKATVRKSESG